MEFSSTLIITNENTLIQQPSWGKSQPKMIFDWTITIMVNGIFVIKTT